VQPPSTAEKILERKIGNISEAETPSPSKAMGLAALHENTEGNEAVQVDGDNGSIAVILKRFSRNTICRNPLVSSEDSRAGRQNL